MSFVYIVVENCKAYPEAYTTYNLAVASVKSKHKEEIEAEDALVEVDVPENASGNTGLYIEKGINILIMKIPVRSSGGKKKSRKRSLRYTGYSRR
jgi:hypothetical protein